MPDQPIHDPRIVEAIEACRPGSDDLKDPALAPAAARLEADPELRGVFERLQRLEATLAEAFRDVPIPDGLAGRITDRLAAVRNGQSASAEHRGSMKTAVPGPMAHVVRPRRRVLRRWLLAGAVSVAAAASLMVAVMLESPEQVVANEGAVLAEALEFFENDNGQGELVRRVPPPDTHPPDADFDVSRFPQMRWRWVEGFLGRNAVAYDVARPGGPRATLYVVKQTVPGLPVALPSTPSASPSRAAGNLSVSAWQAGALLYVLVVDGGPERYNRYVPLRTWT